MTLNSIDISVAALYRLLVVSIMLYSCKVPNAGQAHNYPKMMLSYLLILEHWRQTKHYTLAMMKQNMSCVNEELGEMTFSVLSRCVLGDFLKSDFEHMSKMYSLLPVYMNIKNDIMHDTGKKDSISWRHTVDMNSDEVRSTSFFFKRTITTILANRHQSYDGNSACFINEFSARQHLTRSTSGLVYLEDTTNICIKLVKQLRRELYNNFLSGHHDIWPDIYNNGRIRQASVMSDSDADGDDEKVDIVWGAYWEDCKVGSYSLMRTEFEENDEVKNGVCVYQVVEKNSDTMAIQDPNELAFSGVEFFCTVNNTQSSCLRDGQWNRHRNNRNHLTTVNNYTVITYFDHFVNNHRLPSGVVDIVKHVMSQTNVFSLDDM